ncbi:WD40 repeat domain-containing protein [Ktedonobacter robiniae]|uniref:Anaphase-promoting complex subunit 4-like WD40 domain-containing protein n=1 Tax=Ktedonobacter robiniae TaxID=2778365 RepID=A0ABQ3UL00_9CHLR|nr:PD40 domain-containing protein [Ktedonobacter robiniae]GHO53394.1 hypothetical protein KSB_18690 [Ktedonobacter robiniae]
MSRHEDFYIPEQVDEQVDTLLQARGTSSRDKRLASDLQDLLKHEDEDAYSLQRVLGKFLENENLTQQQTKIIPFSGQRVQQQEQGRFIAMPDIKKQARATERAHPIRRALTTIAAVLVVSILVGSMILVLNAARQKQQNTTTASSNTATAKPTEHEGQVIYKKELNGIGTAVVWSPDGSRVATVINGQAEGWDARTGQHVQIYHLTLEHNVLNISWSPDGNILAVNSYSDTSAKIDLVNAKTGDLLHTFDLSSVVLNTNGTSPLNATGTAHTSKLLSSMQPFSGGGSMFGAVTWSPNSKYLAASALIQPATNLVTIWNANDGSQVKKLTDFHGNIVDLHWSPDGNYLATAANPAMRDSTISPEVKLWNTKTWQVAKQYANVASLEWSPKGKQLALVDAQNESGKDVRIVDALSGQTTKQFAQAGAGIILGVHWSPDGSRIAVETQSGSDQKMVTTLWSAQSGKLLYTFSSKHSIYGVAWSPDSKYLSSFETIQVEDQDGNTNTAVNLLIWVA